MSKTIFIEQAVEHFATNIDGCAEMARRLDIEADGGIGEAADFIQQQFQAWAIQLAEERARRWTDRTLENARKRLGLEHPNDH